MSASLQSWSGQVLPGCIRWPAGACTRACPACLLASPPATPPGQACCTEAAAHAAFICLWLAPPALQNGFVPGALNLPVSSLRKRIAKVPRGKKLYVYCQVRCCACQAARSARGASTPPRPSCWSGRWQTTTYTPVQHWCCISAPILNPLLMGPPLLVHMPAGTMLPSRWGSAATMLSASCCWRGMMQ